MMNLGKLDGPPCVIVQHDFLTAKCCQLWIAVASNAWLLGPFSKGQTHNASLPINLSVEESGFGPSSDWAHIWIPNLLKLRRSHNFSHAAFEGHVNVKVQRICGYAANRCCWVKQYSCQRDEPIWIHIPIRELLHYDILSRLHVFYTNLFDLFCWLQQLEHGWQNGTKALIICWPHTGFPGFLDPPLAHVGSVWT